MPLSLLAGPANAGKVALLLDRYLGSLESDPILIVPNRPDVDRAERELLTRTGALVGGSIGTFDDLFERIARGNGAHRPVVTEAQRSLLLAAGRRARDRRARAALPASAASRTRSGQPSPSSSLRCSSPVSSKASSPSSTPPTAKSSTGSASGTASSSGVTRPSAWAATSTPGAPGPSSPTASRT